MLLNLAWATGEIVGAPAAASASQATSDAVPLLLLSAIMVLTLRPVLKTRLAPAPSHGTAAGAGETDAGRHPWAAADASLAADQLPASHPVTAAGAFPALMTPFSIGAVRLRNRVVSTSHQTSLVHDHLPTDDLIAYHEARARGGVGSIFLEATAIDPTGLLTAHTIGGFLPEVVPAYRRLADAVHAHDARLFVQFYHGGREQISSVAPRRPPRRPRRSRACASRPSRARSPLARSAT